MLNYLWVTPANFKKFIAEVGLTANAQVSAGKPLTSEDLEKNLTAAPKYGIEIIVPQSEQS